MDIIPTLQLEDDDGRAPDLHIAKLDDKSLYSTRTLRPKLHDVADFLFKHAFEEPNHVTLWGGYTFVDDSCATWSAIKLLATHVQWDLAFMSIERARGLEWDDYSASGHRYSIELVGNDLISVAHSRGRRMTFDRVAFLAKAQEAVGDMREFKEELCEALSRRCIDQAEPRMKAFDKALGTAVLDPPPTAADPLDHACPRCYDLHGLIEILPSTHVKRKKLIQGCP